MGLRQELSSKGNRYEKSLYRSGHKWQKRISIDIYYNEVGIITAPSAKEYEEMFQERLKQKRTKEQKTA